MSVATDSTDMVRVYYEPCGHYSTMPQEAYNDLASEHTVNPRFRYAHLNSGCCPACKNLALVTESSIRQDQLSELLASYDFENLDDLRRLIGRPIRLAWYDSGCDGHYQVCDIEDTVIGGFAVFREEHDDGLSWGLLALTNSGQKATWRNVRLL